MRASKQQRVLGFIGVGFDHEEGQIRLTQAEDYQVLMGSDESHRYLQTLCQKIQKMIKDSGRKITDYTPEEFMNLLESHL